MHLPSFMQHFIVFILSVFVGFQVIWNVSHSLHTPLMAVTNAISSIIILGALLQIGSTSYTSFYTRCSIFGFYCWHQHLWWFPSNEGVCSPCSKNLNEDGIMEMGFTTAIYVVSAIVLFILSLGGLSGQESAKRAVWYGIVAMALAISADLVWSWIWTMVALAYPDCCWWPRWVISWPPRVEMTQMPELVAGMHALVGLVAVICWI